MDEGGVAELDFGGADKEIELAAFLSIDDHAPSGLFGGQEGEVVAVGAPDDGAGADGIVGGAFGLVGEDEGLAISHHTIGQAGAVFRIDWGSHEDVLGGRAFLAVGDDEPLSLPEGGEDEVGGMGAEVEAGGLFVGGAFLAVEDGEPLLAASGEVGDVGAIGTEHEVVLFDGVVDSAVLAVDDRVVGGAFADGVGDAAAVGGEEGAVAADDGFVGFVFASVDDHAPGLAFLGNVGEALSIGAELEGVDEVEEGSLLTVEDHAPLVAASGDVSDAGAIGAEDEVVAGDGVVAGAALAVDEYFPRLAVDGFPHDALAIWAEEGGAGADVIVVGEGLSIDVGVPAAVDPAGEGEAFAVGAEGEAADALADGEVLAVDDGGGAGAAEGDIGESLVVGADGEGIEPGAGVELAEGDFGEGDGGWEGAGGGEEGEGGEPGQEGLMFRGLGSEVRHESVVGGVTEGGPRGAKVGEAGAWCNRTEGALILLFAGEVAFADLDLLFEQVFDLAVDASHFGLGPGFELLPEFGIDTEKEGLAGFGGHGSGKGWRVGDLPQLTQVGGERGGVIRGDDDAAAVEAEHDGAVEVGAEEAEAAEGAVPIEAAEGEEAAVATDAEGEVLVEGADFDLLEVPEGDDGLPAEPLDPEGVGVEPVVADGEEDAGGEEEQEAEGEEEAQEGREVWPGEEQDPDPEDDGGADGAEDFEGGAPGSGVGGGHGLVVEGAGVDDGVDFGFAAEDDEEVADHGGFPFVVEGEHLLFLQLAEGHIDHTDGAVDNFLAGGDDGFGLLPSEHGLGDFRGIGEVGEAGFLDDDAGFGEAFLQFAAEGGRDLLAASAEGDFVILAVVIGVGGGEVADGGFALDTDIALVVLDVEEGLGGIADAPDDDGGDFDRVAALIVDLEFFAVEVAGAEGDFLFGVEGVGPVEAAGADGTVVGAEEDEDGGFVGLEGEVTGEGDEGEEDEGDAGDEAGDGEWVVVDGGLANGIDEEGGAAEEEGEVEGEQGPSVGYVEGAFWGLGGGGRRGHRGR